jgi:iron complex transport system substrate-binding protein/vitamin B12 transport system substrate-binding protein
MMRRGLAAAGLLLATTAQASVAVRDGMGNSVVLPAPAKRIVVLVPHAVETLYAIGAGKQLVAAVDYSDYPPAARQLPRVGGYSGLNVEAILQQQPDLIVAWRDGGNLRTVQKLREMGIPVYYSAPVLPADIPREMRALGTLTGQQAGAEVQAAQFEQRMSRLQQRYRHSAPVRVFMQIGEQPIFTVSGQSFLGALITQCGGRNVFAGLALPAPQVSTEAVILARPQLMLAFSPALHAAWQRWPQLPAVAKGLQVTVDQDTISRPGPRLAGAAEQLCTTLDLARQKLGLTPR